MIFALSGKRVFVAGHRGLVGSALVRRLECENVEVLTIARADLDLRDRQAVRSWIQRERPDIVLVAAAKVGGIMANLSSPVDFLLENLLIETSLISGAAEAGAEKLVFLGSSCIYPRIAPQPMTEDMLLNGLPEPTNEGYAIAKIAGIKLCQAYRRQSGLDFISAIPCNLYGPGDNFDLTSSHVIPALMRKAHEAKIAGADMLEVWGSGAPRREFLHVDDLADAIVQLLKHYSDETPINIGAGQDQTITEVVGLVMKAVGFRGGVRFDLSKPDGAPQKLLDASRMRTIGWRPRIGLPEGLAHTYEAFQMGMR